MKRDSINSCSNYHTCGTFKSIELKTNTLLQLKLLSAYASTYIVWGTTYLANLFALEGLMPSVISCIRYSMAGLVLLSFARFRFSSMPSGKQLYVLVISGILMLVGGSGLLVYAESYIDSGHAAVIFATEPLFFVLFDKKSRKVCFSNRRIALGLLMGFAGIVLFSIYIDVDTTKVNIVREKVIGSIVCSASAMLWVVGTRYAKANIQHTGSTVVNSGIQLLSAALVSGVAALTLSEWDSFSIQRVSLRSWTALAFLILMGSVVTYLAYNWLITVQPPALVATHTYVNPIVAVILGALFTDEKLVWQQIPAFGLVLIGIWFTRSMGVNEFLNTVKKARKE